MKAIKKGDYIYRDSSTGLSKFKVERTTKTMIVADGIRYRKPVHPLQTMLLGVGNSLDWCLLETPNLVAQYTTEQLAKL